MPDHTILLEVFPQEILVLIYLSYFNYFQIKFYFLFKIV